ncbi:hypothetical protein NHQ30_001815 [Ciborinia camelliae]|nr:hypothetical protein NHQ30_001815 [Ciborinia camelliae]
MSTGSQHQQPLSNQLPTLSEINTVLSKVLHPFHPIIQRLSRFLDPFNPPQDAIMDENHRNRQQGAKRVPSMERMQVPVPVVGSSSPESSLTRSTFTRMSTPELVGSEFLEPTLAESTYARHAESSYIQDPETANADSKPWRYAQYLGLQREQTVAGNARIIKEQPGAHHSPTHAPQHVESRGVYKAPLSDAEREQRERIEREWRAREERDTVQTEEDNAVMDSIVFEPTIRPYAPKYQSSFADRKGNSSSSASSSGRM